MTSHVMRVALDLPCPSGNSICGEHRPCTRCHRSVEDFTLLKKLYEGNLSVVCQAVHKVSGRHVALKIYKRSRLHEMERFQVSILPRRLRDTAAEIESQGPCAGSSVQAR